jgi:hypothetical protein
VTLETTGNQTVHGIDDETERVSGVLWERFYRFMHTCMHTLSVRGPSLPDLWGPNIHRYLSRRSEYPQKPFLHLFPPSVLSSRFSSLVFSFDLPFRLRCWSRKLAKPRKVSGRRISENVTWFPRNEGKHAEELNQFYRQARRSSQDRVVYP